MNALSLCLLLVILLIPSRLPAKDYEEMAQRARKNIEAWVKADTTNPPGNEVRVAKLAAELLKEADIPYELVEFAPGRSNLVARLKGDGTEKPLLLLAHIDVVGTDGQKWTTDPHTVTEKDGYLMGRGVVDDLGMAAIATEILISLKKEKVALKRDVILALTGDEESGGAGMRFLMEKRPELIDAVIALNEGGGGSLGDDGKMKIFTMSPAEKTYQDFKVVAKGAPGHSSVPLADNAIYRLSKALDKIGRMVRPAHFLPVTRDYFKQRAQGESPKLAAAMRVLANAKGKLPAAALAEIEKDPGLAANLRTTCVATTLTGGTRANVLPPEASANINCRILPDETIEAVKQGLQKAIGDPKVEVIATSDFGAGGSSPVTGEVPDALKKIVGQKYPGVPVIPYLVKGTTDSRYLRRKGIAAYGIGPLAMAEADGHRIHGVDERVLISSIRSGVEFFDQFVMELVSKK